MRGISSAVLAASFILPSLAYAAPTAPVATLTGVSGTVLVDSGNGFATISGNTALVTGARVLLSRDGVAKVAYSGMDSCTLPLSANTITTVTSAALDCHPQAQVAGQAAAGAAAGAAGGGGAGAGGAAAAAGAAAGAGAGAAAGTVAAVVGGVAAAAAVAATVVAVQAAQAAQPPASP